MEKLLSKDDLKLKRDIVSDETRTIEERTKAHLEIQEQMMNPKPNNEFNPETFDPMEGIPNHDIVKRTRITPPDRLPNKFNIKPKEILDGQMIGMYESKQDIYLTLSYYVNNILDRLDAMQTEIDSLKKP